ncbi:RNA-binding protein [Halobacteriovorax marinus]|uniref:RNA-binding protein n=1 Tax=Halobacteriovorax marinus TaxID=97084 RepID=A0A1Y5F7I6_9BACT|nr:RNA-binding protein [Halobacteriovorax marinus]
MKEFGLSGREFIPLCDLLKAAGLCATLERSKVVISQGEVKVDDEVEIRKRCKIRPSQIAEFEGQQVKVVK